MKWKNRENRLNLEKKKMEHATTRFLNEKKEQEAFQKKMYAPQ